MTVPADGDGWAEDWSATIAAQIRRAEELSERVARLSVSATSRDGAVEVTVSAAGGLTDLRLYDEVRRWPADQIAAEIMETLRVARRTRAERARAIVEETVGSQTATGRAVLSSLDSDHGYR